MPSRPSVLLLLALLVGCDERERFVLSPEDEPDTVGPITAIDVPGQDTTVTESAEGFIIGGRAVDPSGIDEATIELSGVDFSFPPIDGQGEDTLRLGIQLPTAGRAGTTITVRIFAVDVLGNPGGAAVRHISIE